MVRFEKGINHEPTPEIILKQKLYLETGLTDEEYQRIEQLLGRLPNWTELGIYSVMWSEHCSYKNSKPLLRNFPTQGKYVIQGPGEGAGVIDIGDGKAVVFKIESHNHPSAVEPFHGAATGVGGIIRDVFSMGARPIALLNSLRFGSFNNPHVRYLFKHVVSGIAHYGNNIEIPTVGGEVYFDQSYEENPLVNAMCVGVLEHQHLQKGIAYGEGNPVIYVGAPTGRDGIHGATFASDELDKETTQSNPSVPTGDPFLEKRLLEACLEMVKKNLLLGIQDMGAAGLTCSSVEMAAKGGHGMDLNLDLVPQREEGMSPYEILLSETQERMLLVVEKGNEDKIKAICDKWELQSAVIGHVTKGDRYRIFHQGKQVVDIPVNTLVDDAPCYTRTIQVPSSYQINQQIKPEEKLKHLSPEEALLRVIQSPNIASKKWVYEQYDYMVQNNTYVCPGSDAAVVLIPDTEKALAMSTDGNSRYVYLDPEIGGRIAVAEAARNIVCSGAEPIGITDGLNFGNPEKPEVYWQLSQAIKGMAEACRILDTPVVGGNVSLYNETKGQSIYPTPIVGMVGLVQKREHITTQSFKNPGDKIILLGETQIELGGSELEWVWTGKVSGKPPKCDLQKEKALLTMVLKAIRSGFVQSAHDLSEGGLVVALAESCMSGNLGAGVHLENQMLPIFYLFSESQSRILLSVKTEHVGKIEALADEYKIPCQVIGDVLSDQKLHIQVGNESVIDLSVSELKRSWEEAIPCAMKASSISME